MVKVSLSYAAVNTNQQSKQQQQTPFEDVEAVKLLSILYTQVVSTNEYKLTAQHT